MSFPLTIDLKRLSVQLAADASTLARAEARLLAIRAQPLWRRSRLPIALIVLAPCIAFCSLIGAVVGLLIALVPLVGPLTAAAIVLVGGVSVAGLSAWWAIGSLRRTARSVRIAPFLDRGVG
jgi:hypothetical protein